MMSCSLLDISLTSLIRLLSSYKQDVVNLIVNYFQIIMIICFHSLLVTHCFSYYNSSLIKILTVNNLILLHTLIVINQSFYTILK